MGLGSRRMLIAFIVVVVLVCVIALCYCRCRDGQDKECDKKKRKKCDPVHTPETQETKTVAREPTIPDLGPFPESETTAVAETKTAAAVEGVEKKTHRNASHIRSQVSKWMESSVTTAHKELAVWDATTTSKSGGGSSDSLWSKLTRKSSNAETTTTTIAKAVSKDEILTYGCCVGNNYVATPSNRLLTCWNDAYAIAGWMRKFTPADNIMMLTDEKKPAVNLNPKLGYKWLTSTTANLWKVLTGYIQTANANDAKGTKTRIVLFYSGHGSFDTVYDPNELTGDKQCWVMPDMKPVWDATILKDFLKQLPKSTTVYVVSDSCHSGSVCDLPWTYNPLSNSLDQTSINTDLAASVILISGCRDNQTSDAGATSSSMSVLTETLLKFLGDGSKAIVAVQLVESARLYLRKAKRSQIPLLSTSYRDGFDQSPFISA